MFKFKSDAKVIKNINCQLSIINYLCLCPKILILFYILQPDSQSYFGLEGVGIHLVIVIIEGSAHVVGTRHVDEPLMGKMYLHDRINHQQGGITTVNNNGKDQNRLALHLLCGIASDL
jgi:hypothetical protein